MQILVLVIIVGIIGTIGQAISNTFKPPTDKQGTINSGLGPAVIGIQNRTGTFTIPFRIVEEWSVGNVIVIDPKFRNDSSFRELGAELVKRYSAETFFNVLIYDDETAAQMRLHVDTVTNKKRLGFYDRHLLGSYTKNTKTGFHALEYSLNGFPNNVPKRIEY